MNTPDNTIREKITSLQSPDCLVTEKREDQMEWKRPRERMISRRNNVREYGDIVTRDMDVRRENEIIKETFHADQAEDMIQTEQGIER